MPSQVITQIYLTPFQNQLMKNLAAKHATKSPSQLIAGLLVSQALHEGMSVPEIEKPIWLIRDAIYQMVDLDKPKH